MFRFRDYSIQKKLTWMNMLVSGAALSLACAAFVAYGLATFRESLVANLSIQAQVVGSNSISALLFNDPGSAEKTLSALQAAPNIEYASIYTPDGQPFAAYWRDRARPAAPLPSIPAVQTEIHWFKDKQITVVRPIVFQGKPAGLVCIRSDLRQWMARLQRYAIILAAVLLVSLLAAWLTSSVIRRAIADPIVRLAETARIVSREKNYSVRAPLTSNHDELAALIATFNEMLAQIQERDTALQFEIAERKQAEDAVKESLATSETALKELADQKFALDQHALVAVTDVQGTITYANDKFCAVSQYSEDELIGQNHRILNSGHHPREFFQQMYHTIANGKVWHGEIKNRAKDGSIYWMDTTIVPFVGADGKPRQYVAIRTDITERKRADEALHESQERFRLLLDGVKDYAIYMLDPGGHVVSWNTGAARIKGYQSEEILGKHFSCFYVPEEREAGKPARELQESVAKGRFEAQAQRVRKDGSAFWANVVITPMYDDSGTLRGFSKVARDITQTKADEREIRKLNDELEHRVVERTAQLETANQELADQKFALDQHAIVAMTDVQGTITYVNDKFCAISQYSKDELIGQNHRMMNSGHHPKEFFQQMHYTIARGKVWHGEIKNRAKDGSIYWLDTTVVPFVGAEGKPRQYAAIRTDITERKQAEERVLQRTAELEAANQELEAFSYSVSHDLRAPLRHIGGFSKMLVEEFGSTLDPGAQHYLDRIQAGTQKMGLLVDELLNLARVGRHALHLQPTRLNSIVAEMLAILQPESEGRRVEWVIADLPAVECDPVLVKQIFQNLLANALKFTRPRAHAVIEVSHKEEDGQPVFMVETTASASI